MAHSKGLRIPKLCLHKASGRAVVRLGGKDVYCGEHGTAEAKAAYDRLITEWLQRGRTLPPWAGGEEAGKAVAPAAVLSVAELILAYKLHTDDYHRGSPSEREKVRQATRPLRQLYGLTPAAAFGWLASAEAARGTPLEDLLGRLPAGLELALREDMACLLEARR